MTTKWVIGPLYILRLQATGEDCVEDEIAPTQSGVTDIYMERAGTNLASGLKLFSIYHDDRWFGVQMGT